MQTSNDRTEQKTPKANNILKSRNRPIKQKSDLSVKRSSFITAKKLSDYINTDLSFLRKNKEAIKEYELFLNRSKYKKKPTIFGSVDDESEYGLYKNNPKLIIISYKNMNNSFKGATIKKYHNNVIGVDEGLITLPKVKKENSVLNSYKIKKDEKFVFNRNNNSNLNDYNPKTHESYQKTNSRVNLSESGRGEEKIIYHFFKEKNKNKKLFFLNNTSHKKPIKNKNFEESMNFKTMIRRLDNWDQIQLSLNSPENLKKEKKISNDNNTEKQKTKFNVLNEIQQEKLKWYVDIKNDPEQLKIMNRNEHLRSFVHKINEEQNAISVHNIYNTKKRFNFDVFNTDNDINKNIEDKNYEEEEEKRLGKVDLYMEIMKDKIKSEDNLTNEITVCAEEVFKSKIKHKNAVTKLLKIKSKIQENENQQSILKSDYDDSLRKLEYLKQSSEYFISLQKNNTNQNKENTQTNSPEKKKKRRKSIEIQNNKNLLLIHNSSKSITNIINNRLNFYKSANRYKDSSSNVKMVSKKKVSNKNLFFKLKYDNDDPLISEVMTDIMKNLATAEEDTSKDYEKDEDKILLIQNIILAKKTEIEMDFNKKIKLLEIEKKKYDVSLNNITKISEKYAKESANLKNIYNQKVHALIEYYYEILKKGDDVRRQGLVWVVTRLIELNAEVDKSHFPNFLNNHQISYLITIGVKSYELKELIKLFQFLKHKQKDIKEQHIRNDRLKEKITKEEELKEIKRRNKNKIGNNYMKFLEGVQLKYENDINFNGDEEVEDKNLFKTSEKLKNKILTMNYENFDWETKENKNLFFIPGSLGEYFSKDAKFREFFDDSYYLNEEIKKRQIEMKKIKDGEMKYYLNRNGMFVKNENEKITKTDREDFRPSNEKVFAALFGNGLSV